MYVRDPAAEQGVGGGETGANVRDPLDELCDPLSHGYLAYIYGTVDSVNLANDFYGSILYCIG